MTTIEGMPIDLLTLPDWERLPEDELHHVECVEGVLVVSPKPKPRHQLAAQRLASVLGTALGPDVVTVPDCEVLLWQVPLTVRAPDLVVVPSAAMSGDPARFTADDVLLAIEVVSPGSRRQDEVMKHSEYAEAGIAEYWIVNLDAPLVTVHDLDGQSYHTGGSFNERVTVTACGATVDFAIADLLA